MADVLEDPLLRNTIRGLRGVDNRNHPTEIMDGFAADLQNIDNEVIGKAQSRKGYTLAGDNDGTSKRILGVSDFNPEGGTQKLLRVKGQAIQFWTGAGNWTTVSSPLTDDLICDIIVASNLAFFLNGTDNVRSYDGSAVTDEGSANTDPPPGTHGEWMAGRLWIAGWNSFPSRLYYSNSLAPQTFDRNANFLSINVGDNYRIRGVKKFREFELMVFKTRGIYIVDASDATPSNWRPEQIDTEFGCIAHRSVAQVGNDIWYLSNDLHVRSILRNEIDAVRAAKKPISYEIQAWIDRINAPHASKAVAAYYKNKYILCVPLDGATRNTHALVYDFLTEGWSLWTNMNILSFALSTIQSTDDLRLYGGESQNSAKVYRMLNGANDNGTAIAVVVETRREDYGLPHVDKSWQAVEVEAIATGGTLTLQTQIDGGGYTTIGTMDLTGGQPQLPIALPFDLVGAGLVKKKFSLDHLSRGRNIQHKLTYSSDSEQAQVKSVTTLAFQENVENG